MKAQALQKIQAIFVQFQNYNGQAGALQMEEAALSICNQYGIVLPLAQTAFLNGLKADRSDDIKKALEYYSLCSESCAESDKILKLHAMSLIGSIYADTEEYGKAYNVYKQVLDNVDCLDDGCLPLIYINISDLFLSLKQYPTALEFASLGEQSSTKVGNKGNQALSLVNMGYALGYMQKTDAAVDHIKQAIIIAQESGITRTEAIGNGYIAQVMSLNHSSDVNDVLRYFEASEALFQKINDGHNRCENLVYHAAYLEQQARDKEARSICEQVKKMISATHNYGFLSIHYKTLINLERKSGDNIKLLALQDVYIQATERALEKTQNKKYEIILQQVKEQTAEHERQLLSKIKEHVTVITKIGQNLATADDLSQKLPEIFEQISTIFPSDEFGIALYDEQTQILDYCYFYDNNGPVKSLQINCSCEYSIGSYIIANKATVHLNQISDETLDQFVPREFRQKKDHTHYKEGEPVQSIILTPIMLGDRILGVLSTQHYQTNQYHQHHCSLFEQLAGFIAIALENRTQRSHLQQANHKLDILSRTEPLTELFNRYQLDNIAPQLIKEAQDNHYNFAVIIIDVDYFKNYNDRHGHFYGDKALKSVANTMKNAFNSPNDHLFRYGGDEFLILCVDQSSQLIDAKIKSLRSTIKALPTQNSQPPQNNSLTLSIGAVNQIPGKYINATFEAYFEQADKALYEIKQSGRDHHHIVINHSKMFSPSI